MATIASPIRNRNHMYVNCSHRFYIKYVVFSKDTCFTVWELCNVKKRTIKIKVPPFGFIENPEDDLPEESEDDNLPEDYSFF